MSMDSELDKADVLLDEWIKAKRRADAAATRHKHKTAITISIIAVNEGIGKAKECVVADQKWFDRQQFVDSALIDAAAAKERYEQAIRRWETARSEYSATKRIQ